MDIPPPAAPKRRAPPQGPLCGRSPASSERRRGASLVAVPAGAPVSVARPRPRRVFLEPHQIRRAAHQRAAPFARGALRVQVAQVASRHQRARP